VPAQSVYEYAVVRIVPRVEREEFVNAGIVLFCKARSFLGMESHLDGERVRALDPGADLEGVAQQLEAMRAVAEARPEAGSLASLTQAERFRWLTAPRSTVVQVSPTHLGECDDPVAALRHLHERLVLPPAAH
jgi:hypothetical protein